MEIRQSLATAYAGITAKLIQASVDKVIQLLVVPITQK